MSRIHFTDYSMPDPADPALAEALRRARYNPAALTTKDALLLAEAAEAYLHFVAHPAPNTMIVSQLREVRREVRKRRYTP